ncbi:MAG: amidase [Williamsia sp.]|nr:amidase [Williamsia sp.]
MDELTEKGVVELAALISQKKVSPVEVVRAHIEKIEAVNGYLNAVVIKRYEEALEEAKAAENQVYHDKPRGALCGIPVTVKESISIKGSPNTFGSLYRKNNIATHDALIVQQIKKAGVIIVGITNTPECNFWVECYNKVYGRTSNPYNTARIPGGSSGGEAAIIGAGGVPFGIGSDIAGSIRMPAAFCGVFGLRPTSRLVSVQGHALFEEDKPQESEKMKTALVIGPMTRKAVDLLPVMEAMSKEGSKQKFDAMPPTERPSRNWADVTVYVFPDPKIKFASSVSSDIKHTVLETAEIFKERGAEIKLVEQQKLFYDAFDMWQSTLELSSKETVNQIFTNGGEPALLKQFILSIAGKNKITIPGLLMCLGERIFNLSSKRLKSYAEKAKKLGERIAQTLSDPSIIIMPVYPTVAPRHNMPLLKPLDWSYTAIFNALDFPAISIPCGLNKKGMPLGIQVIANKNMETILIDAAILIEEEKGGWVKPPSAG